MRNYSTDLAGGTTTTSVQITANGTIKEMLISMHSAAVGKLEISTSPTSQIGTAAPTQDVAARLNFSATAHAINIVIPLAIRVAAFQQLYFHQTGAGNVGTVNWRS